MHAHELHRVRRDERKSAGEHSEEDDAERIDVAGGAGGQAGRLLRRDVRRGAEHRAGFGERARVAHPGNAEVGDLGAFLRVEQDVRGLQVAVHEPALVGMCEAGGDRDRDALCLVVREGPPGGEPLLEGAVRQVLEHHVRPAVRFAVVVERADVRVRERGHGPSLALEPGAVGARCEHLDRDPAVELVVVGEPDGAHRPAAQRLEQPVPACDRLPRHLRGIIVIAVSDLPKIDDALALVLAHVRRLPLEDVPIRAAAGRVLGEDARAVIDLPPFDSSAMDGYAVRAADTPGSLTVVGHSAAGHPEPRAVGPGEAVVISTGAVVPGGADAVVPVERTSGAVEVEEVAAGENVRPRGGDARAGDIVVEAGSLLGPPQVSALAAAGVASVRCARRPRVAVLATGSELRQPGEPLAPGEIYESNSVLIAAQLELVGHRGIGAPRGRGRRSRHPRRARARARARRADHVGRRLRRPTRSRSRDAGRPRRQRRCSGVSR